MQCWLRIRKPNGDWRRTTQFSQLSRARVQWQESWTSKFMRLMGFRCLGNTNWTICSLLSQFCSPDLQTFSPLYWEANSYYPRGLIWEKGILPTPKMDKTESFQCLGHSNWTICSLLCQFCSPDFQTFSPLYWEANSYYPVFSLQFHIGWMRLVYRR